MTVDLSSTDFQKLVGILSGLEEWGSVSGRISLVADALQGSPRRKDVLGSLNLDGMPRETAGRAVRQLAGFGHVTPNQEALGVLVNHILGITGDEQGDFLRGLCETYALDKPIAKLQDISTWKETPNEGKLREESIIGENVLRDVMMLELALQAARGVLLIQTQTQKGSGFLVADNLVMTNYHVLVSQYEAEASEYRFNFQLNAAGQFDSLNCTTALPQKGGLFYASRGLDYAVTELQPIPESARPQRLKMQRIVPKERERVIIIQHPFGQYKKIAMQNNFVSHYDAPWLRYTTSTEKGSSGSPVFNEAYEVVAIHHGANEFKDPTTQKPYIRNEGASIAAVLADLQAKAPEIYQHIMKS